MEIELLNLIAFGDFHCGFAKKKYHLKDVFLLKFILSMNKIMNSVFRDIHDPPSQSVNQFMISLNTWVDKVNCLNKFVLKSK